MVPISASNDFYLTSYEGFSVFVGVVIFASVICCPILLFEVMLVMALEQLRTTAVSRQYKEASGLLEANKQQLWVFENDDTSKNLHNFLNRHR